MDSYESRLKPYIRMCVTIGNPCVLHSPPRDAVRARTNASFYDNDILHDSLNRLMTALMPDHILHRTKRYLRRKCRKPADMKVRTFYQCIV